MKYMLVLVLMSYYIFVLYVAVSPNVGADYRSYYITRDSDVAPKEVERLSFVVSPVRELHNSKHLVFDGWHIAEKDRRWAKRKNPRIIFRLTADDLRSLKGRLGLKMTGIANQSGHIFLNDVLLKEGDLSRLDFLELPFNAEILKDTNEIRFELAQSQVASELDRRVISISIEEIHLD